MDGFNENQMKQLGDLLAPVGNKLDELAQQTSKHGKTLNRLNINVGKLIEGLKKPLQKLKGYSQDTVEFL